MVADPDPRYGLGERQSQRRALGPVPYSPVMSEAEMSPALSRIAREISGQDPLELLSTRMTGSDFTTLMLEVFRRRSSVLKPIDVLHQYENDRFTKPAQLDALRLREMQLVALRAVASVFEPIETSPVAARHALRGCRNQPGPCCDHDAQHRSGSGSDELACA